MAMDTWQLTPESKIEGYASLLRVKHGRDTLVVDLGRDQSEIRHNVARIRKALDQVITDQGGE